MKENPVKGKSSNDNIKAAFIRKITRTYFTNKFCIHCDSALKGRQICKICGNENSFDEEYVELIKQIINCSSRIQLVKAKRLYEKYQTIEFDEKS